MISFEEAHKIVLDHATDFGTETIPLADSIGRVLRQDWFSDRELPPYDRVTMDGIAVHYDSAIQLTELKIEGVVAAGEPESKLQDTNACLEIMTGAVLPANCDTIIRYEDVAIKDGVARIQTSYRQGQNIHRRGEDRAKGELLVKGGTLLSASEIGVGASIGQAKVEVARLPRTLIVSTGNELVDIDQQPAAHQIRRGNVYRVAASLRHLGLEVDTAHLPDDESIIIERLKGYLDTYDLLVLSGGVSKGKFDFLPTALTQVGVEKKFHRIAQRPGKPFWFGQHSDKKTTVFALPGNPTSSFMCSQVYLMDWLHASLGLAPVNRPYGILQSAVHFKPDLTYFLEVKISYDEQGRILAHPQKGHGSGDLANLLNGDAFIRLDPGKENFEAGECHPLYFYR